jgi:hypothetical protein
MTASPASHRAGWVALTVYAAAMALVEAACVVTLKRLYFSEGWAPPFHPIPADALRLEQWREIATLVMIAAVSCLGRPPFRIALARGLWVFGLWDLLYYVFLRLWTGFPASLFDWDLVFLVPRPWIAPVWLACLVSIACVTFAACLLRPFHSRD